jgi:hypothetical protein
MEEGVPTSSSQGGKPTVRKYNSIPVDLLIEEVMC